MKPILIIAILVSLSLFVYPTPIVAHESWDCVIQNTLDKLNGIKFEEESGEKGIIACLILNRRNTCLKKAEVYLAKKGYNPIIISLYLNRKIKTNTFDGVLLKHLKEFKKNEKNNAYPLYLLSCYYAEKNNFNRSLKYLMDGNKKRKVQRYLKQKADILIDYLLHHGFSDSVAYASQIKLYAEDSYQNFRELSYSILKANKEQQVKKEVGKFAKILDNNSYSILDKLLANSIMIDVVRETGQFSEYAKIISKRKSIEKIPTRIKFCNSKEKLLEYLHKMRELGEIRAIKEMSWE